MKKSPFLVGFVIFSLVAILFYAVIVVSFSWFGEWTSVDGGSWFQDSVAVVEVEGVISSSRTITRRIREYAADDSIVGIIVRIDSPGGVVAPAQEIYREIRKAAAKYEKPIFASLGSTAASGGFYVAVACDRIIANPGTLTGSIGVIMEFITAEGAFEKLGLKSEVIKTGRFKDSGNFARSLTAEERAILQETIDSVQRQFVAAVAEGRGLDPEVVAQYADGRIFSGEQALGMQLVDELGTFYDAVDALKKELNIEGKVNLIYPKRKKPDLFAIFFDELFGRARESVEGLSGQSTSRMYYR